MSVRTIKDGQKNKIAGLVVPQTATESDFGTVKVIDSNRITNPQSGFVLPASEKNPSVSGSLAQQISNLQISDADKMNTTLMKTTSLGITDFDLLTNGSYRVSGMDGVGGHCPENSTRGKNGLLEAYNLAPTYGVQFFRSFDGSLIASRVKWDGNWGTWRELIEKEPEYIEGEFVLGTSITTINPVPLKIAKVGKMITVSGYLVLNEPINGGDRILFVNNANYRPAEARVLTIMKKGTEGFATPLILNAAGKMYTDITLASGDYMISGTYCCK